MSDLNIETKMALLKYFTDTQFAIDIKCQTFITSQQSKGIDVSKIEAIYIDVFIGTLKLIEDESMNKLNKFFEEDNNDEYQSMSKDQILSAAGVHSVIYFPDRFDIGFFVHCPFWLNDNQLIFIYSRLINYRDIKIILDKVCCCFFYTF